MYVTGAKLTSLAIAVAVIGVHFATGHADSMVTAPLILVMAAGVLHIWFPEGVAAFRRLTGFFRLSFYEPSAQTVTVLGWVFVGLGVFLLVLALGGGL